MIVEQIVDIPADYRIFLELPRSIPIGIKARVEITIPAVDTKDNSNFNPPPFDEIEEIRLILQKEMAEKGTETVTAATGAGWEAHVKEHYAES